jgi:hypothetical protein
MGYMPGPVALEDDRIPVPSYSTSDADALCALDAVLAKHPEHCVDLASLNNRDGVVGWTCRFTWHEDRKLWMERHAKTRAEAICRAILALAEEEKSG